MSEKIDEIVAQILEGLSTQVAIDVVLPSKGIGYDTGSDGVSVKASNFEIESEAATAMSTNPSFDQVAFLLSKCVAGIPNVSELYQFDKLFLILKIRQATYGTEAKGTIECPSCREESGITFDLGQIPINFVPDTFTDPIAITLPVLGKSCKIYNPRVKHEKYLKTPKATMDNLWRFVHSIADCENSEAIAKIIKSLQ